jgi:hypothetical protein
MRLRTIIVMFGVIVGFSSFAFAQDETPTAEPTPTLTPTETPTVEPTIEPTSVIEITPTTTPTELPIAVTPTLDATATPALETTTEAIITSTPEPTLVAPIEVTTEPIVPVDGKTRRVNPNLLALQQTLGSGDIQTAQTMAQNAQMQVDSTGQRVYVEIIASDAAEALRLRPAIEQLGGAYIKGFDRTMEYYFPVMAFEYLENLEGKFTVNTPRYAREMNGTQVSEGVSAMGVNQYHTLGIRGQGIRIGVIDVGFVGYPSADASCAKALQNFDTYIGTSDHGTNVAEIICDIAPMSEVYLAQATTITGLSQAVDWLISQNVQVINMSMRWSSNGVGDGTGEASNVVRRATNRGIIFVNAAGNQNGDTYHGQYTNTLNPPVLPFNPFDANFHNFGSSVVNRIASCFGAGTRFPIFLTLRYSDWNVGRTGNASRVDLDLRVVTSTNGGVSWIFGPGSFNDQSRENITPIEEIFTTYTCQGFEQVGYVIERYSDNPDTPYLYVEDWASMGMQFTSANASISVPADTADVFAIAASEVKPMSGFPFSTVGYPDLAIYSSRGPAMGPGGTNPTGGISKPDYSAPTNVRTSRSTSFNGTSAAAPHFAGFAALIIQQNRSLLQPYVGTNAFIQEFKNVLDSSVTPVTASQTNRAGCTLNLAHCFGAGLITGDSGWTWWTDRVREENDIQYTGANWSTVTTTVAPLASGSRYIMSTDDSARIKFNVTGVNSVVVQYFRTPAFALDAGIDVYLNGNFVFPAGTTDLNAPTVTLSSFVVEIDALDFNVTNTIELRPRGSVGTRGLTFDRYTTTVASNIQENDLRLNYFGTWTRTPNTTASGGFFSVATAAKSGVSFTTTELFFTLLYTRRPDGGLADIYINGQLCQICGTLNFFSGSTTATVTEVIETIQIPMAFDAPYHVQIVNAGRRPLGINGVPGSIGTAITLDSIRFGVTPALTTSTGILEAEAPLTTPSNILGLPTNGSWLRASTGPTLAYGGFQWTTTTIGAQYNFKTNGRKLIVYYMGQPTGGIVNIMVNGTVCTACGQIDTFAPTFNYRTPYYFTIPSSYTTTNFTVTLVNSGNRNISATGSSMAIDRIESVDGTFLNLPIYDFSRQANSSIRGTNQWVLQSNLDAIGGTFMTAGASNYANINFEFVSDSTDFSILYTRGTQGGRFTVRNVTQSNVVIGTFDSNSTIAIPRSVFRITNTQCPVSTTCTYSVTMDTGTQAGVLANFGYIDGVMVNDGGTLFSYTFAPVDVIKLSEVPMRRMEIGAGWVNVTNNTGTFSSALLPAEFERRTNFAGASVQFFGNISGTAALVYSQMPDGGVGEVYLNGNLLGEISFYSPTPLRQALFAGIPIEIGDVLEIRNTARRTLGSVGNFMYIDAMTNSTTSSFGIPFSIIQETDPAIYRFGGLWTNAISTPTTRIVDPFTAELSTVATSAGIRFVLNGTNTFRLVRSVATTGGIAEVYVNGVYAGDINNFATVSAYRVPTTFTINQLRFGFPPYQVDILNSNRRVVGSLGNRLAIDGIYAVGASLSTPNYFVHTPTFNTAFVSPFTGLTSFTPSTTAFTNVVDANALNGNLSRTIMTNACYQFQTPASTNRLMILRNVSTTGGFAEIYISDRDTVVGTTNRLCTTCGLMNNYSAYARYQLPFMFNIPNSFDSNTDGTYTVNICNTPRRPAGSLGNDLTIDGIIIP